MSDCSNFECPYQVWGKRFRCSQCRCNNNYTCCDCGVNINSAKSKLCKSCVESRKYLWIMDYYSKGPYNCQICKIELPRGRSKSCGSVKCLRKYFNRKQIEFRKKKQLNNSIPVN